nr:MAG TPA: POTASSIUM CHANNEL PROTEIN RCK4 CHANNEL, INACTIVATION GATE [Caudoviricetes sp.]
MSQESTKSWFLAYFFIFDRPDVVKLRDSGGCNPRKKA